MDDKTFIASYVAQETMRINERIKKMVASDIPPSEEERAEIMQDMETTLERLKKALSHIKPEDLESELSELDELLAEDA